MLEEELRAAPPAGRGSAGATGLPAVAPLTPLHAAVAAVGIHGLTVTLGLGAAAALALLRLDLFHLGPAELRIPLTIAGALLGTAVATAAAGRRGAILAIALLALLWAITFVLAQARLCTSAGGCDLGPALGQGWPLVLGCAAGLGGARLLRRGAPGSAALAQGAAAMAVAAPLASILLLPFSGPPGTGPLPAAVLDVYVLVQAVGALAFGAIAGGWGRRHGRDAAVIAAVYLASGLQELRSWWLTPAAVPAFDPGRDWPLLTPLLFTLLGVGALVAAVRVRAIGALSPSTLRSASPGR